MFGRADRQARSPRRTAVPSMALRLNPTRASRKPELDTWELPFSVAPKRFQKTALTDEELERELARSPLYDASAPANALAAQAAAAVAQQGPHQPAAHDRHARRVCAQLAAPRRAWS